MIILIGGASEVINKPAIDMCEYIKDLSETRRKEKKKRSRLKLVQEKWQLLIKISKKWSFKFGTPFF